MRVRVFGVPALLALVLPFGGADAAPACAVLRWRSGQTCTFEPPAGAWAFGGTATAAEGTTAWIAVEVVFNGVVIDSCYASGYQVATCEDAGQAFTTTTHTCRVYGTGGPKFHCADPPLPLG
jgi:hypothetical protein